MANMICPHCKHTIALFRVMEHGALECVACSDETYVSCDSDGVWYLTGDDE